MTFVISEDDAFFKLLHGRFQAYPGGILKPLGGSFVCQVGRGRARETGSVWEGHDPYKTRTVWFSFFLEIKP